jgi:hypothetical protein
MGKVTQNDRLRGTDCCRARFHYAPGRVIRVIFNVISPFFSVISRVRIFLVRLDPVALSGLEGQFPSIAGQFPSTLPARKA